MFRFVPYVLKNLRGHRARTILTVLGTGLLMFLFSFVNSIQEGFQQLTDPSKQDGRLIVYQAFRFCPATSQLPGTYEGTIKKIPGVKEVLPIKVVVNNCRASLDAIVFHGVPPDKLQAVRKIQFTEGSWDAFASRKDGGALVGKKVADRRGIEVGKPFTIAGVTVNVVGIFTSETAGEENLIYTHLAFLQFLSGHHQDLTVTMFEVEPENPAQADTVAQAIDAKIRDDAYPVLTDTKPQKTYARRALADLVEVIGFTRWLGFVCVGVVCVLVANSVLMAAQDRIKEHAVLQTIGYSSGRIFRLMLSESLLISITGGILGIIGCLAWLRWQPLSVATEGISVDFLATPALAAWGLGLSLFVGVVSGLVPAWQAGRRDIVASLR